MGVGLMKKTIFVFIAAIFILYTTGYAQVSSEKLVHIKGIVTDEGIECPAVRAEDGKLYTLTGFSEKLYVGDVLEIVGKPVEVSICMQGITISVKAYKKLAQSGYNYSILEGNILPETQGIRNCLLLETKDNKTYGIVREDDTTSILPGEYTIVAERRLTKDLPCGNVDAAYNLVKIINP